MEMHVFNLQKNKDFALDYEMSNHSVNGESRMQRLKKSSYLKFRERRKPIIAFENRWCYGGCRYERGELLKRYWLIN